MVLKYSRPYRNASEGFLVSVTLFDLATGRDAGVLFDAAVEHAERLFGMAAEIAPSPHGWLRIVPKQEVMQLIEVQ